VSGALWARTDTQGSGEGETVAILPGFVEKLEGELVFCNQDNINTDGIYPGTHALSIRRRPLPPSICAFVLIRSF
jgi:hypothetical protein